jgi:hypothetical protein
MSPPEDDPQAERRAETSTAMSQEKSALDKPISKESATVFLKSVAIIFLGVPLVLGVAWAGDGRPESWVSGLIGLLALIGVIMTSGSNGFYVVNHDEEGGDNEPKP